MLWKYAILHRDINTIYTRRQMNLYRMFFADFSVSSQPIFMSRDDYCKIFIGKYCIAKKLDHLACNAIQG